MYCFSCPSRFQWAPMQKDNKNDKDKDQSPAFIMLSTNFMGTSLNMIQLNLTITMDYKEFSVIYLGNGGEYNTPFLLQ